MKELSDLTPEQRKLMALLLQEAGANPETILPIPKRPNPCVAPLSFAQQRMWFAHRQASNDASYNIQTAQKITGTLQVKALSQALNALAVRHEALRTSFEIRGDDVRQIIHEDPCIELIVTEIDTHEAIIEYVDQQALKPWDLCHLPSLRTILVRRSPTEHILLLGMHHILSDAWSVAILTRELWQLYDGIMSEGQADLPALPTSYADFSHWEQHAGPAGAEAARDFWRDKLCDAPDQLSLPLDRQRHAIETNVAAMHAWRLPAKTSRAVLQLAQANRCSTFAVCLAGFYLLLGELSGSRDVLVASPVANRNRAELESVIGYFANTVLVRAQWSASNSFNDLVHQVHAYSLDALAYQDFPFERVVEEINPRRLHGVHPLAQIFFAFQQYALNTISVQTLTVQAFEHAIRSTRFDLETHVWETPDGDIDAVMIYPALLTEQTIKRYAARWSELLDSACHEPLRCVSSWIKPHQIAAVIETRSETLQRLQTELEQQDCITAARVTTESRPPHTERLSPKELYNPDVLRPKPWRAHEVEPVNALPSKAPALIRGDEQAQETNPQDLARLLLMAAKHFPKSSCRFLSTDVCLHLPELVSRAQQIQYQLSASGVKPGDVLLFQLESEESIITHFWGTVFTGAIPLIQLPVHPDQAQPYEQLVAVWKMLNRPCILTTSRTAIPWIQEQACTLDVESLAKESPAKAPQPHTPDPMDIAFMSLSSGTSGLPKAIPLSHRNVISRAIAARDFTGIDASRILLNWQPLSHIASISDWHIRGICAGSNMIYGPNELVLAQPLLWLDWIEQLGVTDTWAPNFAYTRLVDTLRRDENIRRRWNLSSLRLCLSAGESIVPSVLDEFEDRLASSGLLSGVIQPAFGMAETASGTTYHQPVPGTRIKRHRLANQTREFVSCGRPIPGISVRIINDQQEICYESQIGHVQFRGDPVFSGYYQTPGTEKPVLTNEGWFESGDLGFILDGCLYITGRDKAEIIVNGRNLSCETIEIAVGSLPEVCAGQVAVCGVHPNGSNTEKIALLFVPEQTPTTTAVWRTVRGFIVQTFGILPDYVLAVGSDAIPRTGLGKIRRQALSALFNAGGFDDRIKQQAMQLASIPNSFYRKQWQRAPLNGFRADKPAVHLLSCGTPLADLLSKRLMGDGHTVHSIDFSDTDQINWTSTTSIELLDITLLESSQALQDMARPTATAEHLRGLLQQITKNPPQTCQLTVVTCLTQVTGREDELRVNDAVVHGLLKSAAQELSGWLKCRHIDLDIAAETFQADVLIEEVCSPAFADEVVYRQARRYLPKITQLKLKPSTQQQTAPFDDRGFVVISGGLGGIGRILASKLHDELGIQLLLLGRSPLAEHDRVFLAKHPGLAYAQVDVADFERLHQTIAAHEELLKLPMVGIIHLAGTGSWRDQIEHMAQHRITGLQATAWKPQFDAKVTGTYNLFELVRQRQGASFVATSSVIGEFGASSFATYAAANSFMAAFCRAKTQLGHSATFCQHWPAWLDVGMSEGQQPQYASGAGYLSISPDDGWHIFLTSLIRKQHDLIIGLDPSHPRWAIEPAVIAQYTCSDAPAAKRCVAALSSLSWLQRVGDIEFRQVQQLPDEVTLSKSDSVSGQAELELQEQLKAIVKQVLTIDEVEPDDNFFELGAHSLLMVALESRIKTDLSEEIELLDLFRFPTIARLARHLASLQTEHSAEPIASRTSTDRAERTATQARMRQMRSKHRRGQTE